MCVCVGGGGGGGGGVWIRRCPMAANLLRSVHFLFAPIVLGACLIMLFSEDERGHLGEKNMSGASHCVLSLSKTHLSLF